MTPRSTPGPWRWLCDALVGDHGHRPVVITAACIKGPGVCLCVRGDDGLLHQITSAHPNARLIAAAPDLLAALQSLVASIETWNHSVETIIGRQPDTGMDTANARAAIAKAMGSGK